MTKLLRQFSDGDKEEASSSLSISDLVKNIAPRDINSKSTRLSTSADNVDESHEVKSSSEWKVSLFSFVNLCAYFKESISLFQYNQGYS